MDGKGSALTPLAVGLRLRASESRGGGSAISEGDGYLCPQKRSDGAWIREEKVCPDCPLTKNRPKLGLERLLNYPPSPIAVPTMVSPICKTMGIMTAVYCNRGINMNSILSVEKVRKYVSKHPH